MALNLRDLDTAVSWLCCFDLLFGRDLTVLKFMGWSLNCFTRYDGKNSGERFKRRCEEHVEICISREGYVPEKGVGATHPRH